VQCTADCVTIIITSQTSAPVDVPLEWSTVITRSIYQPAWTEKHCLTRPCRVPLLHAPSINRPTEKHCLTRPCRVKLCVSEDSSLDCIFSISVSIWNTLHTHSVWQWRLKSWLHLLHLYLSVSCRQLHCREQFAWWLNISPQTRISHQWHQRMSWILMNYCSDCVITSPTKGDGVGM